MSMLIGRSVGVLFRILFQPLGSGVSNRKTDFFIQTDRVNVDARYAKLFRRSEIAGHPAAGIGATPRQVSAP